MPISFFFNWKIRVNKILQPRYTQYQTIFAKLPERIAQAQDASSWMFGQPNWKNLRRDIESEDRDFQARRTFCFREEKYVSVAKRRVAAFRRSRTPCHVPRFVFNERRKRKRRIRWLSLSLVSTLFLYSARNRNPIPSGWTPFQKRHPHKELNLV